MQREIKFVGIDLEGTFFGFCLAMKWFLVIAYAQCSPLHAGSVAILEIGPGGALDVQRVSYLSLREKKVHYFICRDVEDDYDLCAKENHVELPLQQVEEQLYAGLGLKEFSELSLAYEVGTKNVNRYREGLKKTADSLTAEESNGVEADLEKAMVRLETTFARINKIKAGSAALPLD